MSHIPDEELHAYLDQALSRSQCVVIESHLAECPECRAQRDAIAALRDQTTLLLGKLAPARRIPPSLEELRRRQPVHQPVSARMRALRIGAMAASLAGAIGLGYSLRSVGQAAPVAADTAALVAPAVIATDAPGQSVVPEPGSAPITRKASRPTERPAPDREAATQLPVVQAVQAAPSPSIEYSTDSLPREPEAAFAGIWRTVPWDGVRDATGSEPSRVMGVPVEEVQMQPSRREGAGPVTMVAQRLSSGEIIQTIEGPAADVSQLLDRRGDRGLDSSGRPAEAMQRGDRMIVVTGELPSDSLRALVRRVNAAMRVR